MEAEGNPLLNTQSTLASAAEDDPDVNSQDLGSSQSQGRAAAQPAPQEKQVPKQKDRPLNDPTVSRKTLYNWTHIKFAIFKEWAKELRCSVADLAGFFIHLAFSNKVRSENLYHAY